MVLFNYTVSIQVIAVLRDVGRSTANASDIIIMSTQPLVCNVSGRKDNLCSCSAEEVVTVGMQLLSCVHVSLSSWT